MQEKVSRIRCGEEELFRSSEEHLMLIFKNLTGENFQGEEYQQYLEMVSEMLDFQIDPAKVVFEVCEPGEEGK